MPKATQNPTNPDSAVNVAINLDPRWIVKIEGRDFVTYPGLLDLGHQKGLESIEVEPLQLPNAENGSFAVCRAVVTSKEGETFTDIGDACPENCSKLVSRHLLRMASTRSIARALRTFTNIGMTCLEELDGDYNANDAGNNSKPKTRKTTPKAAPKPKSQPSTTTQPKSTNGSPPPMSDSQKRAIWAISRRQNLDEAQVDQMCNEMFNRNLDQLTVPEASSLITHLQNHQQAA